MRRRTTDHRSTQPDSRNRVALRPRRRRRLPRRCPNNIRRCSCSFPHPMFPKACNKSSGRGNRSTSSRRSTQCQNRKSRVPGNRSIRRGIRRSIGRNHRRVNRVHRTQGIRARPFHRHLQARNSCSTGLPRPRRRNRLQLAYRRRKRSHTYRNRSSFHSHHPRASRTRCLLPHTWCQCNRRIGSRSRRHRSKLAARMLHKTPRRPGSCRRAHRTALQRFRRCPVRNTLRCTVTGRHRSHPGSRRIRRAGSSFGSRHSWRDRTRCPNRIRRLQDRRTRSPRSSPEAAGRPGGNRRCSKHHHRGTPRRFQLRHNQSPRTLRRDRRSTGRGRTRLTGIAPDRYRDCHRHIRFRSALEHRIG